MMKQTISLFPSLVLLALATLSLAGLSFGAGNRSPRPAALVGKTGPITFNSLGCWRDQSQRAIPLLEGNPRLGKPTYRRRPNAIRKCAKLARSLGFTVFAIQNGGACASSATAEKTYKKYGTSTACKRSGKGGPWANHVYRLQPTTQRKMKPTIICENRSGNVSCPSGQTIQVTTAYYGRKDRKICGRNQYTKCEADGSLAIIKKKCDSKNSCLLTAENSAFGDPCVTVPKYIFLEHDCTTLKSADVSSTNSSTQLPYEEQQTCDNGLELSSDGECIDIDECFSKPCGVGWCINTLGSYNCSCPSGTQFNNNLGKCEDINECLDPTMCVNGKCVNLLRTYGCYCNRGYIFNKTTSRCDDLDECSAHLDICHFSADCTNLHGHYKCTCKANYEGDGILDCRLSSSASSSFKVMCHASEMKLQVESWIIDVYGAMTLRDTTCKGNLVVKKSGTFWEYAIKNNLASCQNNVQSNGTHTTYSNILVNNASVISPSGVVSGVLFEAIWSCVFKTSNIKVSLESGDLMGAGYIEFPRGLPDKNGKYPSSPILKPLKDEIVARTESPGGSLVTDPSGAVVPERNPDGSLKYGPGGGRFVPVTDKTGNVVTNAAGNVVVEVDERGSMVTRSPLELNQLDGSSLDPNVYGGKEVAVVKNFSSVIEGAEEAGEPVLPPVTLPNGTVVVPGLNYTLSAQIQKLMPGKLRPKNGITVKDVVSHQFGRGLLNGTGSYEVKMLLFTDDTFRHLQKKTVFTTNDLLHIRAAVITTDTRLAIVINRCWGTPDHSPDHPSSLSLIEKGCAIENKLQDSILVLSNGESRTSDFQTRVFKFDGFNETYLHCEVDLCNMRETQCQPKCIQDVDPVSRLRRSADAEALLEGRQTRRNVTIGPYHVWTPGETQKIVIPAVVFISLIALVALLLLFCLCRRRRRRQIKKKLSQEPSFENETMIQK